MFWDHLLPANAAKLRETQVINKPFFSLKVYIRHSIGNVDNGMTIMLLGCKLVKNSLQLDHPVQFPIDNQEQQNNQRDLSELPQNNSQGKDTVFIQVMQNIDNP